MKLLTKTSLKLNQSGIIPLVLVLFAGFWILFSIGFLDRWYFKLNKPFLATNPVITSEYLASQNDSIDNICIDEDDVECGGSDSEGDGVQSNSLASAE